MRAREGSRQEISLGALIALTDEVTPTPAPRRDAWPGRVPLTAGRDVWARMTALERGLAADRDDPDYDYAAN
jgi:hypothetical protein